MKLFKPLNRGGLSTKSVMIGKTCVKFLIWSTITIISAGNYCGHEFMINFVFIECGFQWWGQPNILKCPAVFIVC